MFNYTQPEVQAAIQFSLESQTVSEIASHHALFGARLDSIEQKASELEEDQLEVGLPAVERATNQVPGEKNLSVNLDQQSMAAIYQRLAELEMFLMIGAMELVEIPLHSK